MKLIDLIKYLLLNLVCLAQPSFAAPTPVDFSGRLSRWNQSIESPEITYYVIRGDHVSSFSTGDLDLLSEEAAALWNAVPTSYALLIPGDTHAMIQIHFEASLEGAESASGYASFTEYDSDDHPKTCEIHVDVHTAGLAKTLLHEIGHCLGLAHSLVPEAIMSYQDEKNSFAIDTDDAAALSRLYPADGSDPKKPLGCGVSAEHTGSKFWLMLLLLLPLLFASGSSRKKSKR